VEEAEKLGFAPKEVRTLVNGQLKAWEEEHKRLSGTS